METKDIITIVTIVVTALALYHTWINSTRTSFINTVTGERVKWIGKLRENMSRLMSMSANWQAKFTDFNYRVDLDQLVTEIRLQLNPREKEDHRLEELLMENGHLETEGHGAKSVASTMRNEIITLTQTILKREWDRVKKEAKYGDISNNTPKWKFWKRFWSIGSYIV